MIRSSKPAALAAVACSLAVAVPHPPNAAAEPADDLNNWALVYTGGSATETTGNPVRFGYANSEAALPEATVGLRAAVAYVNNELGGIDGRPLEIVECSVDSLEDAGACAAQFANDDSITLVLTGVLLHGNAVFYETLNGKKPILIGNGLAVEDFTTPAGVTFTSSGPGIVSGLASFTADTLQPTAVAAVYVDNAAGNAAANLILKPAMDAAGITASIVPVPEAATAPDIASALAAAGADRADVVVLVTMLQGCIAAYDSLQSLGIDPVVVTTGLCFGTPMTQHLADIDAGGDFPDGWYFGAYGYNYFMPDYESGVATYIAKVVEYGEPSPGTDQIEYSGFAGPTFANVLTAVQLLNKLDDTDYTFPTVDEALRGFRGPMMAQAGPIECGVPPFVAICGHQMGIQQYVNGGWISVADGLNGRPIDATF